MPWFPWTENIKKRVCRYLLQHYLGQYLQQKLEYDQLSVDLYNGAGCVQNVKLDVFAINEAVQKANAPMEILDGSVQSLSVSIPWKNIFSESCVIEIRGIRLTIQPKYMAEADLKNMTDSFCNSLKNMTTSMQVAQECLNDPEKKEAEREKMFEGLEIFAQTIENIFRRIKVRFRDISLCFEHLPSSAAVGIGLHLKIQHFEYFDEDSDKANEMAAQNQSKDNSVFENVAFSCKQFQVSGVDLSVYQFPRTKSSIVANLPHNSTVEDAVLIAQLFGEQQVKVRIKQNEQLSGPKIDGELYLGDCAIFLTPKHLRVLIDFIDGFTTPSSNESSYTADSFPSSVSPPLPNKPPENKIKVSDQSKEINSFLYDCNGSDFYPVNSPNNKPKAVQFCPLGEVLDDDTFKSTVDHFTDKIGDAKTTSLHKCIKKSSSSSGSDLSASEVLRLQIKMVALSLTVLHVDPADIEAKDSSSSSIVTEVNTESSVDGEAHSYLLQFALNYFKDIRKAFELYGLIDLFRKKELFNSAGRKHDHLRVLAGPLHIECERKTSVQKSLVSTTKLNASVGNAELLECLYNVNRSSVDCIELLVFPSLFESTFQSMHASAGASQCLKLSLELVDSVEMLHTSIKLDLTDCKSEVDISIIDRLSDLLYCFDANSTVPVSTSASGNCSTVTSNALYENDYALFQKVLDESEAKRVKVDFEFNSSQLSIDFRFPIPDLRPELQRRPWFQRMLRDEVLYLTIKDLKCQTKFISGSEQNQLNEDAKVVKLRFKEMCASYSDETNVNPKLFLQTYQFETESDYDWPFVQINFHELKQLSQFHVDDNTYDFIDESILHFPPDTWEAEHDNIPLFNSYYELSVSKKPSPFSHRKVIHNNEKMILPGDEEEIQSFVDHASATSKISVMLKFPVVNISVPSKSFIESLYNRFGNDLLLWEPAAPQPIVQPSSEVHSIPARLDIESQFFSTNDHFVQSTQGDSSMPASFMSECDESSISFMSKNTMPVQQSFEKAQSFLSLSISVSQGSLSLCSNVRSSDEEPSQTGQIFIELENGSLFIVSQYLGNPNLDYICVQVNSCGLYHKIGLLSTPLLDETRRASNIPDYLNSLLYPVNKGVVSAFDSGNLNQSSSNTKMVTVVLKQELEEERSIKRCLVAALLNNLTLRHQFLPVGHSFLEQLLDIFDLQDTPVLGYEPPTYVTEVHFHVKDCALDYKPIHLTSRAIATISSFALSSNVVADSPLSNLQIVMDNVNVHLSDNCSAKYVDLRQNFVNVLAIDLLELCIKLSNQSGTSKYKIPDLELVVSNSHIRMWTCADSCALLAALVRYIAEDGDMVLSHASEEVTSTLNDDSTFESDEESSVPTTMLFKIEEDGKASFETHLQDLIADAVVEINTEETVENLKSGYQKPGSTSVDQYKDDTKSLSDFVIEGDDDFCVIDDMNTCSFKNFEPKVEYLVDSKIVVIENYFTPVIGRADQLKPPDHFPEPLLRYAVRELSLSWYIFGGNDFSLKENGSKRKLPADLTKRSPLHLDKKAGGVNRDYKVLMEFHMTKARFHQEIYSPEQKYASRIVFAVSNFEVHDRLQSSQINKFLYHFHNVSSPKQSNADMLLVKALLVRAEKHKDPECKLRVSLQPLRLNIDQDSLIFLTDFFGGLASSVNDDVNFPFDDGSTYGTAPSTFAEPRLEVKHHNVPHQLGCDTETDLGNVIRPLFFNEFIFSPAVPIRLDYHGKRIDIEQGKLAGLLMGLGQLNCSQLKLQKIVHRHGLLGFDKLVNFTLNEWAADIRNNQLPSILGGVGPIHSFVQFFQGLHDLVWLPVEQYRRDGRIVRGLQRGTTSFSTSTSMAVLELTNRLVWLVQATAETACDIVSPADFHRSREKYLNSWRGLEKQARRRRQPSDLREGFNNAVTVVNDGVTDTAYSIARVAQKEHERKGLTGAVGGVIRHIPLTLVRPVAIASEATSNVLSGMRNQILPDARKEDEDKWRDSANAS